MQASIRLSRRHFFGAGFGAARFAGLVLALPANAALELAFSDQSQAAGVGALHAVSGVDDPLLGDEVFDDMVAGFAVLDFDRDGWPDLYVLGGGLRRDSFFVNQGDGTFVDRAAQLGVSFEHFGSACAVGDYDGDGWLDVYVTSFGPPFAPAAGHHKLLHNRSGQGFVDVAAYAGVDATSASTDGFGSCFGDYDLDGDLDLFVCGWRIGPLPALGNRLFRNDGDGTFTDVTQQAGVEVVFLRGFSPTFADVDGDRYPELLVVGDFGTSQYFANDGDGTFTNLTGTTGTGFETNGMGSTLGDLDHDGRLDWYVTSIFADGNSFFVGNKLYLNAGNHTFFDVSQQAGVDDGGWGWGTSFADFDHDGWLDLFETNGWYDPTYSGENCYVWQNAATGQVGFVEAGAEAGVSVPNQGRGCAELDYDRDGDRDVVVSSNKGTLHLLRNDLVPAANAAWATIVLDTSAKPRLAPDGFGTRVVVTAAGQSRTGYLDAGCHYMTTGPLELHFGLGAAAAIDAIEIHWADGTVDVYHDRPVNRLLHFSAH